MKDCPMLDEDGALKNEARKGIIDRASEVECECPHHLLKVIEAINDFQEYETNCLINDLKQRDIHEWLLEKSHELELTVSKIIIELMQKEGFVDEDFQFVNPPKV